MRLIDADKAYDNILEASEGGNYVDMDAVDTGLSWTPTVEAIPVEWIKEWFADELDLNNFEEYLEPPYDLSIYVQSILEQMMDDWRKENESSISN